MNKLRDIENKYHIENIYFDRYQVWPIIRMVLFFKLREKNKKHNNKNEKISKINSSIIFNNILNIDNFKAIFNLIIGRYKFALLTDSLELRNINGHFIDKISYNLINIIDEKNIFIIENSYHYKLPKNILYKNCLNQYLIRLIIRVFIKVVYLGKAKIENEETLKGILNELNISLNYYHIISEFISSYKFYKLLFKIGNIKVVFVNCYYSLQNQAAVFAARELNINVIELQHGIINEEHPAYYFSIPMQEKYFPNYLFAFGEYIKDILKSSRYIKNQNIIAIGNAYIDYIKNEYKPQTEIFNYLQLIKDRYDFVVAVSLQEIYENETIEFIKRAAIMDRRIYYILVPRNYKKYSESEMNLEIYNINNSYLDIYKIIIFADYHSTVSSTCALEAPALGVANIFINIDNKSKEYYGNILDPVYNRYANNPNEFIKIIREWASPDKEAIKSMHIKYYENNNRSKIIGALNKIGIETQYK